MQQTYLCEIAAPAPISNYGLTKTFDFTKTYGFAPRYSEYKTSFDRYNGDFCLTMNSWVTGLNTDILKYHVFEDDDTNRLAPEMFNCRPRYC